MGLLQDLGQPADCPMYDGKGQFQLEDVKERVEAFAAEVAARGQHKTELAARMNTYEQAKTQLYHLTGLQTLSLIHI